MTSPARTRVMVVLATLAVAPAAGAAEREFGVAAGFGSLLAPADPFGGVLSLSAAASPSSGGMRLVRARGEIAILVGDGAWAVLPSINGDAGLRLGRFDLYVTGGLELFGPARRSGYTMFSNLGLVGGAGMAMRISPRLRLGVRGLFFWLPSFSGVKLDAPEGAEEPKFLYVMAMLSLEILGGQVTDSMDFDED